MKSWFLKWLDLSPPTVSRNLELLSTICVTLWSLWQERNSFLFSQTQLKTESVIQRANAHLTIVYSHTPSITIEKSLRWSPPEENTLKLNFDAAWCPISKHGYVGWILRNHLGEFIAGGAAGGRVYNSAKEAEADAAKEGLIYAKTMGHSNFWCEGDAKAVVDQLSCRILDEEITTEILLWDCLNLAMDCNILGFIWTPRLANSSAHHIAAWAKYSKLMVCCNWVSAPPWLQQCITDDANPSFLSSPDLGGSE